LSRHIAMPPKRVEKIVSGAAGFLRVREVTTDSLLKMVKLDLLSCTEVEEVAQVISSYDIFNCHATSLCNKNPLVCASQ
jgi:hypothetical protein